MAYALVTEGLIRVIPEKHLRLGPDEIMKMALQFQVPLSMENARALAEVAEGNSYAIGAAIQYMVHRGADVPMEDVIRECEEVFVKHLEQEVIPMWDTDIQSFLMMVSVVDEFTLPLAVMITGDDQAAKLLNEVAGLGNFMFTDGNVYRLRPFLIKALSNRALQIFGLSEYRGYMANAAHYFEMQNDTLKALELYEKCEKKENIRKLLIRNGRRHPGIGHYYELRKYYFALADEDIENTPTLMSAVSLLYYILMNPEKSEYWYNRLLDYTKTSRGGEKREAEELLLFLDLSLPHRGPKGMQNTMKHAFSLMMGGGVNVPELSVTNNGPSAMNGGMDFCEWSKKDKLLADTIGKIVENVAGNMGRGLVHAALCESIFEKGTNDAEATHHAMLLNFDVEGGGRYEMMFVSVAIQARKAILNGNPLNAMRIIDAFENHIKDYSNEAMKANLDAFRCRVALTAGDSEYAKQWLKRAPDEVADFCILERYRYMTKAVCYTHFGMNEEAISVLSRLRYYAEEYQRSYIHMETGLLLSIVSRRNRGEWKELFLSTLFEIQDFRFVRIISEKGTGMLPLLKEIKKDYLENKKADPAWFKKVMKEAEEQAKKYPTFLNCSSPQANDFNEVDIQILTLQAEGLSTREIGNRLFMSECNVKYHASENYKKLGASGKVEAVQIAKQLNLI